MAEEKDREIETLKAQFKTEKEKLNGDNTKKQETCKSRNVLYLWQCLLCEEEDSYIGRTIQKSHERTNTHRGCFTDEKWESSALSMHSKSVHANEFNLKHFRGR